MLLGSLPFCGQSSIPLASCSSLDLQRVSRQVPAEGWALVLGGFAQVLKPEHIQRPAAFSFAGTRLLFSGLPPGAETDEAVQVIRWGLQSQEGGVLWVWLLDRPLSLSQFICKIGVGGQVPFFSEHR